MKIIILPAFLALSDWSIDDMKKAFNIISTNL